MLINHVCLGLELLLDNFESVSAKRVNCQGKERVDPTVYLGTAGISYALLRACSTGEDVLPSQTNPASDEEQKQAN